MNGDTTYEEAIAYLASNGIGADGKKINPEQYNGWANRETWAFWLHVTNDQGWYESVREFVAERTLAASQNAPTHARAGALTTTN